jgi:cation diffusion facilitator CzcD-associated flavoprotein CzcO
VKLVDQRVAVIGTGASAIQFVPRIQPLARRLFLYQRTPPWILPRNDRAIPTWRKRLYAAAPATQAVVRAGIHATREAMGLPFRHPSVAPLVRRMAMRHLEASIEDPALRAKLTPSYTIGCKRILISDDYLPALEQPNVELVTPRVASVDARSVLDAEGVRREVDTIIFATGFRATDPLLAPHVRGRDGRSLADEWRGSPKAHLGTTVAGFPNLFILLGPNTGLGHSSVLLMMEAQVEHVLGALALLRARGAAAIEPRAEAQEAFVEEMERRLARTVWNSGGCRSWYLDRTGRNSSLWPGGTWSFRRRVARIDASEYVTSGVRRIAVRGAAAAGSEGDA